ncbi:NADH dehydrogenase subunit K [Geothermobacter ehrlichii]|uniref:NADH-quinone oxidoreductase subunit K n=1 Tax=Geothermobacter ehrlichii TaxID=213224 RepID=A0A5D3WMG6_9BACT|nr:NADH-quinone oxidoreductase subunit NuoK [Geothermobacter ehrlichii]TYO99276.1 NADH dehydrogenase subunit K [Geothermobacter ehrlichii]
MIVPLEHVLIVAGLMFCLGLACVLTRRSLIMILIGVEVMINAVGLALVGASAFWRQADGQLVVVLLMALTSAEVSISLAMVVYLNRRKGTIDADAYDGMKG